VRQQRDPGAGAVVRVRLGNAIDIRQDYGMEAAQSAVVQAGACVAAWPATATPWPGTATAIFC
jgi:hypothetical protein